MWWPSFVRAFRAVLVIATAAPLGACFQPLYSQKPQAGGGTMAAALASIDVAQIPAPRGSSEERLAVELRNALLFDLTGGSGNLSPVYRLNVRMATSESALIVDIQTGRTVAEVSGIDTTYTLTELATKRVVVNGQAFARVSSDVPGLEQRFANLRALRDAQSRAVGVVASQIQSRLSSYLIAGT
jgi:LPS-assembly lipoprotein